jgi:putative membrane protein
MHFLRIASVSCCLAGAALAAGSVSRADKEFMITAAKTDMIEAHEGQMAENQASRSDVKDFAKKLVDDHTQDYGKLTALAAKTGVTIPTGINSAREHDIAPLVHLNGAKFDKAFTRDEVAAHRRVVAEYKREAEHGQDADVKAFAAQQLPVVQKHLEMAESCEK